MFVTKLIFLIFRLSIVFTDLTEMMKCNNNPFYTFLWKLELQVTDGSSLFGIQNSNVNDWNQMTQHMHMQLVRPAVAERLPAQVQVSVELDVREGGRWLADGRLCWCSSSTYQFPFSLDLVAPLSNASERTSQPTLTCMCVCVFFSECAFST